MKVVVVSSSVFSVPLKGYGGLEEIAYLTAKGLAAKGYEVTLVAPDGSECDGCSVWHTGPAGRHDEHSAFKGYKYVQRDANNQEMKDAEGKPIIIEVMPFWPLLLKADVVVDSSWQKWAYTLKAEGVLKCPVLGVTHAPVNTMWQSPPPVEKPCIVCISEDQASHYRALFNQDARCCYNGVDIHRYQSLGIPRSDRFLFCARFSSVKSPHLAQEACKRAGVGLDLIGDTSITQEPDYYNQCVAAADGKQIKIIGPSSRGETVWWYSQARALLHPIKTFREPFGLSVVESQLCGTPVIAWRNGSMSEVIKHEETGFLVSSLDEMVDVIKRGSVDRIDRSKCRHHASRFSVEAMVARYEELALEALKTGGW